MFITIDEGRDLLLDLVDKLFHFGPILVELLLGLKGLEPFGEI